MRGHYNLATHLTDPDFEQSACSPKLNMQIQITAYDSTTAAGLNIVALRQSIAHYSSGLRKNDLEGSDVDTMIGRVPGVESVSDLGQWQSRNNALAALGYEQGGIRARVEKLKHTYGAHRVGVLIGTSTSSIDRTEQAYQSLTPSGEIAKAFRHAHIHNPHAPGLFIAYYAGITGPSMTINTACSSSAKIFATASRWLQSGLVDAVLVGGVDSLCLTVVHGFNSLQLVSRQRCRPFDQNRDGTNLGEAAAYAVLEKNTNESPLNIVLSGYGESSDAHHMSHPHPEGLGARLAIEQALQQAHLLPADIQYINLHGTSTPANDLIEGQLVQSFFPTTTVCSSTKAWLGHTLGAAGIVEAVIAMDTLSTGLAPGSLNLETLDHALDFNISATHQSLDIQHVLTNSFGFGGNNCSLIFSQAK